MSANKKFDFSGWDTGEAVFDGDSRVLRYTYTGRNYATVCYDCDTGDITFFNSEGELHREDGPAVIYSDGTVMYWRNQFMFTTEQEWRDSMNPNTKYYYMVETFVPGAPEEYLRELGPQAFPSYKEAFDSIKDIFVQPSSEKGYNTFFRIVEFTETY